MTNNPFGFGPGSGGDGDGDGDSGDLAGKMPLFAELQKLMSWQGGPVNWDLARQVAISQVAGDTSKTTAPFAVDVDQVRDALRLADMWLDDVTDLPSGVKAVEAWSPVQWIERTQPAWATLCDPVAARVSGSMTAALPEEMRAQADQLGGMMTAIGGMMFGTQVGQALGALSAEVLTGTEIGLPLTAAGTAVLLPRAVDEFAASVDRPGDEVRLYLGAREAAYQRLFAHVPWLRQRLLDTVDAYARGITIDTGAIEQAMGQLDPGNPAAVQEALSGGLFEVQETPDQQAALRRLETLLALVEGWVDTVVTDAIGDRLPGAGALHEAVQRRRASGGPAEQTFATLVGLELRPRRLREAAQLWAAAGLARGRSGRDALWAHPDLLPTPSDLDDPVGFAQGGADLLGDITVEDFALPPGTEAPSEDGPDEDDGPAR